MTQQPFSAAALRGAVDLSALKRSPAPASGPQPGQAGTPGEAGSGAGAGSGELVVTVNDETFQDAVNTSMRVPVIAVLWSGRLPQSADFVGTMTAVARRYEGRFQLASVNVDDSPRLLQAFGVQSVPMTIGFLAGQAVPLFLGAESEANIAQWVDELLTLAVQNGVTGRVSVGPEVAPEPAAEHFEEPGLPPLHAQAYDAIDAGDYAGAAAAFEAALAEDPADVEAKIALAQVHLIQRTADLEPAAARARAAADPADVAAATDVADLDFLGGHVEDAFARLVDTVRMTSDADRDAARAHLLGLFELLGPTDPRVVAARRSLMSAWF